MLVLTGSFSLPLLAENPATVPEQSDETEATATQQAGPSNDEQLDNEPTPNNTEAETEPEQEIIAETETELEQESQQTDQPTDNQETILQTAPESEAEIADTQAQPPEPVNITPTEEPNLDPAANSTPTSNERTDQEIIRDLANRPSPLLKTDLEELQRFADAGLWQQGFEAAEAMLDKWEGAVGFDFYYGLFALESQNYDHALFAFERLVAVSPNNMRYRLELARALYQTNNLIAARDEFNEVLATDPPTNVRKRIERIVSRINAELRRKQSVFYVSLDVAGGYDSNINSTTYETNVDTEIGVLSLDNPDATGTALASSYTQFKTSIIYSKPISRFNSMDFSFRSAHKRNAETDQFDIDLLNGNGSFGWQFDQWRLRAGGALGQVNFGGETLYQEASVLGDATYLFDSQWSSALAINVGKKLSQTDLVSDTDVYSLTLNASSPPNQRETDIYSFTFSDETANESELIQQGKSIISLSYLNFESHSESLKEYWSLNLGTYSYKGPYIGTFDEDRNDTLIQTSYGWEWTPYKYLVLFINGTVAYNNSNSELFTYPLAAAEVGLRLQY